MTVSCREQDKVDLGLIVEGGRHAQPSKRLQGLDYPETITKSCKKNTRKRRLADIFTYLNTCLTCMIQMVQMRYRIWGMTKTVEITLVHQKRVSHVENDHSNVRNLPNAVAI